MAAVSVVVLLVAAAPAADESSDGRFVQGLRERQLYRLAESFCEKRLADAKLPLPERADLVVHLSQTCVDHARSLPPDQADALWTKSVAAPSDFVKEFTRGNWRIVVGVQGALAALARGELSRQRAEVTGDPAPLIKESQDYLRTATRLLRDRGDDLTQALRELRETAGEPTRLELLSVERHLKFHLARAYRNQALCYADESADRDNSLRQALELLAGLAALATVDPLAWQARVEEITCLRLMKRFAEAERRLADLLGQQPPGGIVLRAQAERIRLHVAQGRLDDALKQAQAGRQIDGLTDAELDMAQLETHLAAWRAAGRAMNKEAADAAQAKANEIVQTIDREYAPYWSRRAEALLASVISDGRLGGDLALRVRAAQGFYRGKQFADAVRAYDEAAKLAVAQKQLGQAFDLAYTAATIEHEQKNHAQAKARYRQLALDQPKHAKAAEAHLLAAFNAGQEARQRQPINLDEFTAILREHLKNWGQEPTTNQARWQLGQCYEFQRRWSDAIATYREMALDHERFAAAVPAVARCYDALLAELKAEGKSTQKVADEAAGHFERLVLRGEPPRWPERWTPAERSAAAAACRLRIDYRPVGAQENAATFRRAEQILTAAIDGQPAASADWKPSAQCLLLVALAGQRQHDKAGELLKEIGAAPPTALLDTLRRLIELSPSAGGDDRRALGKVQAALAAVLDARRQELDEAGRRKLERLAAQAVAASGDAKAASAMFAKLAAAYPKDGDIQEAYAAALLDVGDRPSLDAALAKWREIERHSREGTPRWFRARYHVALAYVRLGDGRRAAELIKTTQVLYAELGGPELKARFLELLKQAP